MPSIDLPHFEGTDEEVIAKAHEWTRSQVPRRKSPLIPQTLRGTRTIEQILKSRFAWNHLEECCVLGEALQHNGFSVSLLLFRTTTDGIGSGIYNELCAKRTKTHTVNYDTNKAQKGLVFTAQEYTKKGQHVVRTPHKKVPFPKESLKQTVFEIAGFRNTRGYVRQSNITLKGSIHFVLRKARARIKRT